MAPPPAKPVTFYECHPDDHAPAPSVRADLKTGSSMFCNLIVQPLVSFHSSRLACLALPSPWHKIGWCMQGFSPKCGCADVKFCTRQIIEVSCHSCFNRFKHALKKRFLQVQSTRNCFLADMFCWKLFKYRNFGILFRLWSAWPQVYHSNSQSPRGPNVFAGLLVVCWTKQHLPWSKASRMLDPSAKCQRWHFAPNVAGLQCVYFLANWGWQGEAMAKHTVHTQKTVRKLFSGSMT